MRPWTWIILLAFLAASFADETAEKGSSIEEANAEKDEKVQQEVEAKKPDLPKRQRRPVRPRSDVPKRKAAERAAQRSPITRNAQGSADPRKLRLKDFAKRTRIELLKCRDGGACDEKFVKAYDTDGDGRLSPDEINAGSRAIANDYQAKVRSLPRRQQSNRRQSSNRTVVAAIRNRMATLKKFKTALRVCNSGEGCSKAVLKQVDRNRDGKISPEEREKAEKSVDDAYRRIKDERKRVERT